MEKGLYEKVWSNFIINIVGIKLLSTNIYAKNNDNNIDIDNEVQTETNYEFTEGKLTQVKDDNGTVVETNKYENGMRSYKSGNTKCEFIYDSQKHLLSENRDGVQIEYNYEYKKEGDYYTIIGFKLDGVTYSFTRNDENKIAGICNEDNDLLAQYRYDGNTVINVLKFVNNKWVDCNDKEFIGNINKIRNIFAYYDEETDLYYENGVFYNATTNKMIREPNPNAGIALMSYYDDLEEEVSGWRDSLLNDDTFNSGCSHTGTDWWTYYSDVEVLARTIYGEQTNVIRDQDAIAWVVRNRSVDWDWRPIDVISERSQFSALGDGDGRPSDNTIKSQDPEEPGWRNAVYAACVLCTTLDQDNWEYLNEKPLGMTDQKSYRAYYCDSRFFDSDPIYYTFENGNEAPVYNVWVANYPYNDITSADELQSIIGDYQGQNIFFTE